MIPFIDVDLTPTETQEALRSGAGCSAGWGAGSLGRPLVGGSVFGTPLTGTSGVGFGAVVLRHQFAVVLHPIQRQVVGVFTVTPATFDVLGAAHGAALAVSRLGAVCLHSATEVVSLKSVNDIAGLEVVTRSVDEGQNASGRIL